MITTSSTFTINPNGKSPSIMGGIAKVIAFFLLYDRYNKYGREKVGSIGHIRFNYVFLLDLLLSNDTELSRVDLIGTLKFDLTIEPFNEVLKNYISNEATNEQLLTFLVNISGSSFLPNEGLGIRYVN